MTDPRLAPEPYGDFGRFQDPALSRLFRQSGPAPAPGGDKTTTHGTAAGGTHRSNIRTAEALEFRAPQARINAAEIRRERARARLRIAAAAIVAALVAALLIHVGGKAVAQAAYDAAAAAQVEGVRG